MSNDNELLFILRAQNQASDAFKAAAKDIEALAGSAKQASTGAAQMSAAMDRLAGVLGTHREGTGAAAAAAKVLDAAHAQATATLREYTGSLGLAGQALQALGPYGTAAAAGLGAMATAAAAGINAYAQFERQGVKLNASLRATGQAGKATYQELFELAGSLSRGTVVGTDDMAAGLATLVRNAGIAKDQLATLGKEVRDFAAGTGRSVQEAAPIYSRIYSDPQLALRQISREMRNVSQVERQRIEDLADSGQYEQARALLRRKLSGRNTGQAEDLTGGIAGAFQEYRKEAGELVEEQLRGMGEVVARWTNLEGAIRAATRAVQDAKDATRARNYADDPNATYDQQLEGQIQRLKDARQGQGEAWRQNLGPDASGLAVLMGSGIEEKQVQARIDELRAKQAEYRAIMADHAGSDTSSANASPDLRKIIDQAVELLPRLDSVSERQKTLGKESELLRAALSAALMTGSSEAGRLASALQRVEGAAGNLRGQFQQLRNDAQAGIIGAGLGAGDANQFSIERKYAEARAAELGTTGGKIDWRLLSGNADLRRAAQLEARRSGQSETGGLSDAELGRIREEVAAAARSEFAGMAHAGFERDQATRTREEALIRAGMLPGVAGERARIQLEQQRQIEKDRGENWRDNPTAREEYNTRLNQALGDASAKTSIQAAQAVRALRDQLAGAQYVLQAASGGGSLRVGSLSGGGDLGNLFGLVEAAENRQRADGSWPVSPKGARGPMQVLPGTFNEMARKYGIAGGIDNETANRAAGQAYLRDMIAKFGDVGLGLAAYNAGPGRVDEHLRTGRALPAETQAYVSKIMGSYRPGSGAEGAADVQVQAVQSIAAARETSEAFNFALNEARNGTMGFQQALAAALPIIRQRAEAERELALREMREQRDTARTAAGAKLSGGEVAGREAQWAREAFSKGYSGPQAARYVEGQRGLYAGQQVGERADEILAREKQARLTRAEAGLATGTAYERDVGNELAKLAELVRGGQIEAGSSQFDRYAGSIRDAAAAAQELREKQGPLYRYIAEGREGWEQWQSSAVTALNATENALGGLITGTTSLKDAVAQLASTVARDLANSGFKALVGSIGGSLFGGSGGSGAASAFEGAGTTAASFAFANGGIMTSAGPLPLHRYASGGVASSPQLALYGEQGPEAYVPLPDGRSIPVSMKGGGGGNSIVVSPTINVSMPASGGGGGQGGGYSPEQAQQLGQLVAAHVRNEVVNVLTDQQRVGGSLAPVY